MSRSEVLGLRCEETFEFNLSNGEEYGFYNNDYFAFICASGSRIPYHLITKYFITGEHQDYSYFFPFKNLVSLENNFCTMSLLEPKTFFFELPLYTPITIDSTNEEEFEELLKENHKVDAYNPFLREETTYSVSQGNCDVDTFSEGEFRTCDFTAKCLRTNFVMRTIVQVQVDYVGDGEEEQFTIVMNPPAVEREQCPRQASYFTSSRKFALDFIFPNGTSKISNILLQWTHSYQRLDNLYIWQTYIYHEAIDNTLSRMGQTSLLNRLLSDVYLRICFYWKAGI